ncbi:hypothetical protein CAPNMURICA_81 [Arthrobacter phage CapnMurica]|uniref:Uncharacterized protein n=1 Tax=Arthrobacter phage CapnMurica TaxID=1772294 RepID=A0A0U3TIB6_9CAUD|nr:hypothetical protein FDH68_gp81 [Arthrobacter phage CaptnMurica]ALY08681.1 hypothetical protein CAPNMURICA_81 [Arthrobacter phage CaptnMurica]
MEERFGTGIHMVGITGLVNPFGLNHTVMVVNQTRLLNPKFRTASCWVGIMTKLWSWFVQYRKKRQEWRNDPNNWSV